METIFALATAQGKAGVAVIRVSGPLALDAGSQLCGRPLPARGTSLRVLRDKDGLRLDEALVLTFTGQTALLVKILLNYRHMAVLPWSRLC